MLERIRASGRPLVLFTNGSHIASEQMARGLTEDGIPVADHEVMTPVDSATTYLRRYHPGVPAMLFASQVVRERLAAAGIRHTDKTDAGVVFIAHVNEVSLAALDRAAHVVAAGAPLLTGSYARGYAGANGIIFSRGAMITAAIAKVTGARPKIIGKPSRAAVNEVSTRLGLPPRELAVIGDDLDMDIALGRLGGSQTILVRTGTSGSVAIEQIPERRRPDAAIDGIADLLAWL